MYSGKNFVYGVVKDNRGHYKKVLVQVIYDKLSLSSVISLNMHTEYFYNGALQNKVLLIQDKN